MADHAEQIALLRALTDRSAERLPSELLPNQIRVHRPGQVGVPPGGVTISLEPPAPAQPSPPAVDQAAVQASAHDVPMQRVKRLRFVRTRILLAAVLRRLLVVIEP